MPTAGDDMTLYMQPNQVSELLETRQISNTWRWMSVQRKGGKILFREVIGRNSLRTDQIGLTRRSIRNLDLPKSERNEDRSIDCNLRIAPAGRLRVYWNHPDSSVRIGYKLGCYALALTIVIFAFDHSPLKDWTWSLG